MNLKLLFVEDDRDFAEIVCNTLQQLVGGYEVRMAHNGEEGLRIWKEFQPDVIVTDVLMPCVDGIQMVKRIRETDESTVIIFTSVLTSPDDVGSGYDSGADDYIKKPFAPKELHAFIQNYLKRIGNITNSTDKQKHSFGIFTLNTDEQTLVNASNGEARVLGYFAATVLRILVEHRGEVVKRETFTDELWKNDWSDANLTDIIYRLRELLKEDERLKILTIRGVGYKLIVEEEEV